jgi:hypothetical protein
MTFLIILIEEGKSWEDQLIVAFILSACFFLFTYLNNWRPKKIAKSQETIAKEKADKGVAEAKETNKKVRKLMY